MGLQLRMIRTARVRSVVPSFRKPRNLGQPQLGRVRGMKKPKLGQPPIGYSYFNALIGSTRDARCAGMKPAQSATSDSATVERTSTVGSAPVI